MTVRLRRRGVAVVAAAMFIAVGGVLAWPVTTRQGLDYNVSAYRLPLYVKAAEFVRRSARYGHLARGITADATTDEAKTLAAFEWTGRNVRDVPAGFPVVDDHILSIITLGYGAGDQMADVFATLTTYAGVPAFWARVPADPDRPGVILTFVMIDGQWRVFDAFHRLAYRTGAGVLATLADIGRQPDLIPEAVASSMLDGASYRDVVSRAPMPAIPEPLRAELQMPLPRVWHELKTAIGVESDDEP